jgi:SNF2 family DNA or RNA helicase
MGTGKSFSERYILYKNMFSGTYKNVAVMTVASVIPAWLQELSKLGVPYRFWKEKTDADFMTPGVVNIMSLESIQLKTEPSDNDPVKDKELKKKWNAQPFLKKVSRKFYPGMFDLIIVDESHKLNSNSNLATKLLTHIVLPQTHVLLSTGTPFSNGLHEAFSQMDILRPGLLGPNITHFRNTYCEDVSKNPKYRKWQLRPCYTQEITQRVYQVSKFQKIIDGITLPPLTVTDIEYKLTEEQLKFQAQIREDHIIPVNTDKLPNGVPVVNASRASISLKTLCSGFIAFDFMFPGLPVSERIDHTFSPDPKLERFMDLVTSLKEAQALVWIDSIRTGEMLKQHLASLGYTVALINSTVSKVARQPIIRNFLDNKIQFIVAHPKTLGTGLDFLNAIYQIFYELSYSLTEYEQAQKRSHRIGQKNHVIIYRMIGRGSIEKAIGYALEKKLDVETYLFSEYLKSFKQEELRCQQLSTKVESL